MHFLQLFPHLNTKCMYHVYCTLCLVNLLNIKTGDRKSCFCSNQITSYAFASNPVVRTRIETVSPVSPWISLKVKASHFYNLETFSQCKQMAAFPIQELSLLYENRGQFSFYRRLRFKIFISV